MVSYYYEMHYNILYKIEGNKCYGYIMSKKEWIHVHELPKNLVKVTPYCINHPVFAKYRFYKELLE